MGYVGMDKLYREGVWAVVGEHPDDGSPSVFSRWFTEGEALDAMRELAASTPSAKCRIAPNIVWRGLDDNRQKIYFSIPTMHEVAVSLPSLESIKAKLSDAELKVLGLKR